MKLPTPIRLALFVFFAVWGLALTGALSGPLGAPGVIQSLRLKSLLRDKQAQITRLESELRTMKGENSLIEHSVIAQQREVRRVLGYAAPDELIFDFGNQARLE